VAEDVDILTRKNATISGSTTSSSYYAQPCKPENTTTTNSSSSSRVNSSNKEDKKRMRAVYEDVLPPKELDAKSRMSDQRKATADRYCVTNQLLKIR